MGWRLALADPDAVTAVITQNGNGYEAGLVEEFWKPMRAYWADRTAGTEAGMRQAFTLGAIQRQYLHGVPDPGLVSPDGWLHDYVQLSRPGNDQIQLALFADYATNLPLYPKLHDWLRDRQIPVRPARSPSPTTRPTPRFTCSTGRTSCWRATWTT